MLSAFIYQELQCFSLFVYYEIRNTHNCISVCNALCDIVLENVG